MPSFPSLVRARPWLCAVALVSAAVGWGQSTFAQSCEATCADGGLEYYVDDSVTSSGDGKCWSTAKRTLQEALDLVTDNAVIYVAAGTYFPSEPCDPMLTDQRDRTFCIPEFTVSLKGGYRGGSGSNACDRDFVAFETILTGERGDSGPTDNCKHVVTAISADDENPSPLQVLIEGFTIIKGYNEEPSVEEEPEPCIGQPLPRGGAGLHWRQRLVEVRD
jgi:hypothetical protein